MIDMNDPGMKQALKLTEDAVQAQVEAAYIDKLEDELVEIARVVSPIDPTTGADRQQDSMDYAMIVSAIRRLFEADEEFYINLHAKVRARKP